MRGEEHKSATSSRRADRATARQSEIVKRRLIAIVVFVSAPAAAQEAPPAPAAQEAHVRGGLNLLAGVATGGGMSGPVVGGAFRLGWQFNRHFAFYGQGELLGWTGSLTGEETYATGGYAGRLIGMGTYSPRPWLELGLGPSLDGAWTSSSSEAIEIRGPHREPVMYGGAYFGFHEHVGFRLPLGLHHGPSLVVDVHSMVGESRVATTFTGGIGYEWW